MVRSSSADWVRWQARRDAGAPAATIAADEGVGINTVYAHTKSPKRQRRSQTKAKGFASVAKVDAAMVAKVDDDEGVLAGHLAEVEVLAALIDRHDQPPAALIATFKSRRDVLVALVEARRVEAAESDADALAIIARVNAAVTVVDEGEAG